MYIKLKRMKENVVYVNGGCVVVVMNIQKSNLTMEEIFFNKRILKKLTRKGKNLTFYTTVNKAKALDKP